MSAPYAPEQLRPMLIHGRWYNFSGFIHPGGPIMMRLGEGRDATAMFEAHHPFTSRRLLEQLLAQHEVTNPSEPAAGCRLYDERDNEQMFEWPEPKAETLLPGNRQVEAPISAFALELRSRVRDYFAAEARRRGVPLLHATKATLARRAQLAFLFAVFIATVPSFFAGRYWTLLATPLAYWLWVVNCFHDASHFAMSRDWRVNALLTYTGWWFSSPLPWYHEHVIGHHAYPNIPNRDPDLYHNGTFERHTKTLRHRPLHSHQHKTWIPIWLIGTFALSFLKNVQLFSTGYYNRAVAMVQYTKARIYAHFAGRLLVLTLAYLWPFLILSTWFDAVLFSVVPAGLVSFSFMVCSQVNHLTSENVDVRDPCYYAHQVKTSHSFGGSTWLTCKLAFLFSGGLSLQIEHHLFPTINHCHLPHISQIVKEVCKKHGVFYHESAGFRVALGKYFAHLKELSVAEIIAEHTKTERVATTAEAPGRRRLRCLLQRRPNGSPATVK